ncbi:MAG TPA: hypothetical protein VK425_12825, partial [Acidimicrobiales bacterium]|nr:hypothetical protein [Acidimicrobiales bacterium]
DGSTELTYPSHFIVSVPQAHRHTRPGPGRISNFQGTFLQSPDGAEIVMGLGAGLAIVSGDGKVLRTLSSPTAGPCSPQQWWWPGVALASCAGGETAAQDQYWQVPVSGAA